MKKENAFFLKISPFSTSSWSMAQNMKRQYKLLGRARRVATRTKQFLPDMLASSHFPSLF